jgi:hypothetical protein
MTTSRVCDGAEFETILDGADLKQFLMNKVVAPD